MSFCVTPELLVLLFPYFQNRDQWGNKNWTTIGISVVVIITRAEPLLNLRGRCIKQGGVFVLVQEPKLLEQGLPVSQKCLWVIGAINWQYQTWQKNPVNSVWCRLAFIPPLGSNKCWPGSSCAVTPSSHPILSAYWLLSLCIVPHGLKIAVIPVRKGKW